MSYVSLTCSRSSMLRWCATASIAASAVVGYSVGYAQDLEEIVVTAQKRAERLQDVPLSIAVVDPDALGAVRFNQSTDLQYLVPGLQVSNAAGPRSFGFYVRGLGTNSFSSESIEGSVAYVLDGVVLGQAGAALTDLPDIERIEVLRGPQGTLFGKNASAGVISIVTRRPTDSLAGGTSLSWSDPYNDRKASAWVSGPFSGEVRGLISVRANQRDGLLDNVHDGRELNDAKDRGARGKLEWLPSDSLDVTLSADWWKRDADCCIWTLRNVNAAPSAVEVLQMAAGIVPGPGNLQQNLDAGVFSDVESGGASAQVNYDLATGHTFTSITAWRTWETLDGIDTDNSPLNIRNVNYSDFEQQQVTQEFRLSSPADARFNYVVGLFYFDSDVTSVANQRVTNSTAPYVNREVANDATTTNYAIFGQANFDVTERLRLIAGARLLQEEATARKRRVDTLNTALPLQDTGADKTDEGTVWRVGLQYNWMPDFMTFATVTRGYKSGGFDTNIGFPELRDVRPEIPTNYEIGLRSQFLDQRLTLNFTAFETEVTDYQVSARDDALNAYFISNAAQARTRGVEMEGFARPFVHADFTVALTAAFVDAQWDSYPRAPCYAGQTAAQGCVGAPGAQNITGQTMPRSPEWTGTLAMHYELPIGSALRLFADASGYYRDAANVAFPISPLTVQEAYTLLNASLGVGADDGRWRISVFGKNLGDEQFVAGMLATPLGTTPGNVSQYPVYESQRIVGLALDVSF